jgi:serine protease AprX
MARRASTNNHPQPRTDNPFLHVAFSAGDVFGVETTGGGGKEFCDTDADYRAQLNRTVAAAGEIVAANAQRYPGIPTVLAMRVRPEAIAKSHRPMALTTAADMHVIGHGAMDEMLVEATSREMGLLSTAITSRDSKAIRANLSAISEVVAWDATAKLPPALRTVTPDAARETLRATGRLWIKLFRYRNDAVQAAAVASVDALLRTGEATRQVLPQAKGPPVYIVDAGATLSDETLDALLAFPGVRSVAPEPQATAEPSHGVRAPLAKSMFERNPPADSPIVAVFDTGVHPAATLLAPWVSSTETFITDVDTNYEHGTMVASLVADARGLNEQHSSFPITACRVHDVCGLESGVAQIGDLIVRLRQALANRSDIPVWNLSLGAPFGVSDEGFSELAQELDALSDQYGVLFVVAAGNYVDEPRRGWPCGDTFTDRISSPADSVRALTVGAITHEGSEFSYVAAGEPASYSRRGPGPVFTPKPDVVHVGGGFELPWNAKALGIKVLAPNNGVVRNAGTSFAAPIVAAMAAQTWNALGNAPRQHGLMPSPTLIKALMIHSAELASPPRTPVHRRYYGAGVPSDPMAALYDGADSFTLVFEADLTTGTKWRKAPYPIPPSLLVDGTFRGEVIMTAVYAPPVDGSNGAEYVRANVEVGFGTLEPDEDGDLQFKGRVPMKGEQGTDGFEKAQVEHGGKWSPVKIHRKVFSGVAGTNWALQAIMLRRANEAVGADPMRTIIIITLRSVDGHDDIYNEGARALAALNWVTQSLPIHVPINVRIR